MSETKKDIQDIINNSTSNIATLIVIDKADFEELISLKFNEQEKINKQVNDDLYKFKTILGEKIPTVSLKEFAKMNNTSYQNVKNYIDDGTLELAIVKRKPYRLDTQKAIDIYANRKKYRRQAVNQ